MPLAITPETKIGALLDAYPALEDTLVACAPAFARLKNPVLRKTVAKVATLHQAARIGGIGIRELVVRLRKAAGQDASGDPLPAAVDAAPVAAWLPEGEISQDLDVDRMLDAGDHPLGAVRRWLAGAQPAELIRLRSSFLPQPLIDELRRAGLPVHAVEISPGRYETLIRKAAA